MERDGGGRQRWPRRRVLGWAVGLASTAGAGWAATRWLGGRGGMTARQAEDPRDTLEFQRVALLCFAGLPAADSWLSEMKSSRPDGPTCLLQACRSLEKNDENRVRWHLAFPSVRDTPEARLLLKLMDRRTRAPDWRHAFFEAWKALGRPDFRCRKSPVSPGPETSMRGCKPSRAPASCLERPPTSPHPAFRSFFTVFPPTAQAGSSRHRAQFSGTGFVGHTPLMP